MKKITTIRTCSKEEDQQAIIDFLYTMKEEFLLPDRTAVEEIVNIMFEKGGIVGLYKDDCLVGFLGYFLGDPADDYADKAVGFLYIIGVSKPYRLTRVGHDLFHYTVRKFERMGLREIRLQAQESNPYTNRLYARFANPVGRSVTRRGARAVSYSSPIDDVLAYWDQPERFKELFPPERDIAYLRA
jgi:GNAT superfamily N-acetyltransferase